MSTHSFRALATRCAFVGFFNMCALCALCMRTVYAQRASNTLCMRCQLASFSQILTKVGRTTTYWSNFSYFYARTVRRVCVTGPLAALPVFNIIFECGTLCRTHEALERLARRRTVECTICSYWSTTMRTNAFIYFHHDKRANLNR